LSQPVNNVVLVHGGFVDGSGWQGVYDLLTADGFRVSIVQHATFSLAGDVVATRRVLDAQNGPCVLVGHSYGGAVVSEAGTHDAVAALVYVAAFAPDKGESVNMLIADPEPRRLCLASRGRRRSDQEGRPAGQLTHPAIARSARTAAQDLDMSLTTRFGGAGVGG